MRFSRTDVLVTGACASLVALFSFLFYAEMQRKTSGGGLEVVGSLTFKRKVAQRKYAREVAWEELEQNSPVYNYDSLRTDDESEANINLKDGTIITLNENSMILLEITEKKALIKFEHGSIKASGEKAGKSGDTEVKISSGNTVVDISKSDVAMTQEEGKGKDLNLTVIKGEATLETDTGDKKITENQQVVASAEEIKIYPINLVLLEPGAQAYLITESGNAAVHFAWKPVNEQYRLFLEVSQSASFTGKIRSQPATGDAAALSLATGSWYWRLRGVNTVNNKEEFSEARHFAIVLDEPVGLIAPQANAAFSYKTAPPLIWFKWSKSDQSAEYHLLVARDEAMTKEAYSETLINPARALDVLEEGTYWWRVEKRLVLGESTRTSMSAPRSFTITRTRIIPPPRPLYPPQDASLSQLVVRKKSITFTWDKEPEVLRSTLSIARDAGFGKPLYAGTSNVNFLAVTRDLAPGDYYWKVAGTVAGGGATGASEVRRFRVVESENIAGLEPAEGSRLTLAKGGGVRFSWKRAELDGNYDLELARDREFKAPAGRYRTEESSRDVTGLRPGAYYWRVTLRGDKQEQLLRTPVYAFQVLQNLDPPEVVWPQNGETVNMSYRNTLPFSWKGVEGAGSYAVELFQVRESALYSQLKTTTRETKYTLTDLSKLDIGKFCLVLRGVGDAGAGDEAGRMSPEVRVYFNVTLEQTREKIKLKTPKLIYVE